MAAASKEPDLLEQMVDGLDPDVDLLEGMVEDDSEGWVPSERGEGIQGVVIKVGETKSDYSEEMAPVVTLETKTGEKFRIIGYGAVLRREIIDNTPEPGDLMAVKYWGEKPIKNGKFAGKPYKHYSVVVKKGGGLKKSD